MLKKSLLLVLSLILLGCGIKVEDVQSRMEEALHSKYGEDFVVENIGLREANGQKFYQARIYPKSIVGTEKEDNSYYYATSSINLKSPNRLSDGVGDSYNYIKANDDVEKYLLPKAKEVFGEMIRLKVDCELEVTSPLTFDTTKPEDLFWGGYKASSFEEIRRMKSERPKTRRIILNLYVYIFDRIETDEEFEGRREETFEFIQYLKKEKLFEYLEMGVIFVDERVLAPSYKEQAWKLSSGKKEEVKIGEKTVFLPRKEVREQLSVLLKEEVDKLTEEELILNMNKLKKSDLSYKGINRYNARNSIYTYSSRLAKEKYSTALEKGLIEEKQYDSISDIKVLTEIEHIYQ